MASALTTAPRATSASRARPAGTNPRMSGPSPDRSTTFASAAKGASPNSRPASVSASPMAFQLCGLRGAASSSSATARALAASKTRRQPTTAAAPPGLPHSTRATPIAPRRLPRIAASTAGCVSASA